MLGFSSFLCLYDIAKGEESSFGTLEKSDLYKDKNEFLSDSYENNLRKKYGFDFTELKQNELIERDPFLGSYYNFGAEFKNHGWLTSPSLYIKELANHFKSNGGKIIKK